MRIYVDFDDCICKTADNMIELAHALFNSTVEYNDMHDFNLQNTFSLNDSEIKLLMEKSHTDINLLLLKEVEGAVEIINKWLKLGHTVEVVTGRPFFTYGASRRWLDEHGLNGAELFIVDKYGRDLKHDHPNNITLDEMLKRGYGFCIEDSETGISHIKKIKNAFTAVMDTPWNRHLKLDLKTQKRCRSWQEIDDTFNRIISNWEEQA